MVQLNLPNNMAVLCVVLYMSVQVLCCKAGDGSKESADMDKT